MKRLGIVLSHFCKVEQLMRMVTRAQESNRVEPELVAIVPFATRFFSQRNKFSMKNTRWRALEVLSLYIRLSGGFWTVATL